MADFIEEKTAIDDHWHGGEVDGQMVVNIALATSQANMYKAAQNLCLSSHT